MSGPNLFTIPAGADFAESLAKGLIARSPRDPLALSRTIIYLPTIRSEEQYLREHFAGFDDYARKVPRLLPRFTAAPTDVPPGRFSSERYLHHREYNALMGAIAIYAALAALLLFLKR